MSSSPPDEPAGPAGDGPPPNEPNDPDGGSGATRRSVPTGLIVAGVLASVVLAVAVLVAIGAGRSSSSASSQTSTMAAFDQLGAPPGVPDLQGRPLPAVTYTRFGDDSPQTIAQNYAGKPLVINFWASTCAPCITEMPAFEKVHEQFGDKVAFLGLDVTDTVDAGQTMLDKTHVQYDVGRDPRGDALVALGGSILPTTLLVSADGTVKLVHGGEFSGDDLKAAISQTLLS
jgi:thiol-disulfide isomerase/thioredoxin